MKTDVQELAAAINEADYYATEENAIFGDGITGVVTAKTFATDIIERYKLPDYMAWHTGDSAQYDQSSDEYIGFDTLEEMADYIETECPLTDYE